MMPENTTTRNESEEQTMYVCTEIAAAESIEGLNYGPQKATQR